MSCAFSVYHFFPLWVEPRVLSICTHVAEYLPQKPSLLMPKGKGLFSKDAANTIMLRVQAEERAAKLRAVMRAPLTFNRVWALVPRASPRCLVLLAHTPHYINTIRTCLAMFVISDPRIFVLQNNPSPGVRIAETLAVTHSAHAFRCCYCQCYCYYCRYCWHVSNACICALEGFL